MASNPGGPTSKRDIRRGCIVIVGAMIISALLPNSVCETRFSSLSSAISGSADVEAARRLDRSFLGLGRLFVEPGQPALGCADKNKWQKSRIQNEAASDKQKEKRKKKLN
jgi:hypothetical protein